jgi:sec-independent protein translocase protein TatA
MGLSFWHLIILLIIVLLFFGPNRLPGLGKSVGEAIRGFKKGLEGDEIDVQARRDQLHNQQSQQQHNQQYGQQPGQQPPPPNTQQPYNNQQPEGQNQGDGQNNGNKNKV